MFRGLMVAPSAAMLVAILGVGCGGQSMVQDRAAAPGKIDAPTQPSLTPSPPSKASSPEQTPQPTPPAAQATPKVPPSPSTEAEAKPPAESPIPTPSQAAPRPQQQTPEGGPAKALDMRTVGEVPATRKEIEEKVQYAGMMFTFKPSQRVLASDNAEAKGLLSQAKEKAAEARARLAAGDLTAANALVNESYRLLSLATAMVPSEDVLAMERARYADLREGLAHAKELYGDAYDRVAAQEGEQAVVAYDVGQVGGLAREAEALAGHGRYGQANELLVKARALVDTALAKMLHQQVVTYTVDVSTPKKEYEYELGRYVSYEELIPVAIQTHAPDTGKMVLINRTVEKARWMAAEAKKTAAAGDYPKAIRMITDASKEVRKALKIIGVKTYE
ncbi:MAG: hypothetical protein AB1810_02250 [Pseudomonadota bacterium]